jgi:hypothetical protein
MLEDNLMWIISWYNSQCNGFWESPFAISIETLDNPGWNIVIGIQETELEKKMFQEINLLRAKNDWIFCEVKNGYFQANCGTFNLVEVLQIFRNWIEDKVNDI